MAIDPVDDWQEIGTSQGDKKTKINEIIAALIVNSNILPRIIGLDNSDLEAWDSDFGVLEAYQSAIMYSKTQSRIYMIQNAYFDGVWKRKVNAVASMIEVLNGNITIYTVAAAAPDIAFTWIQQAKFNASGMQLNTGADVSEFSIDGTLAGNSDDVVPTEQAVNEAFTNNRRGTMWVPGTLALSIVPGVDEVSDGFSLYSDATGVQTFILGLPMAWRRKNAAGTYEYLRVTTLTISWYQDGAADDLARVVIDKRTKAGAAVGIIDDSTGWGSAGNNTQAFTINTTLDATYVTFRVVTISVSVSPSLDWRLHGYLVDYEYI